MCQVCEVRSRFTRSGNQDRTWVRKQVVGEVAVLCTTAGAVYVEARQVRADRLSALRPLTMQYSCDGVTHPRFGVSTVGGLSYNII